MDIDTKRPDKTFVVWNQGINRCAASTREACWVQRKVGHPPSAMVSIVCSDVHIGATSRTDGWQRYRRSYGCRRSSATGAVARGRDGTDAGGSLILRHSLPALTAKPVAMSFQGNALIEMHSCPNEGLATRAVASSPGNAAQVTICQVLRAPGRIQLATGFRFLGGWGRMRKYEFKEDSKYSCQLRRPFSRCDIRMCRGSRYLKHQIEARELTRSGRRWKRGCGLAGGGWWMRALQVEILSRLGLAWRQDVVQG